MIYEKELLNTLLKYDTDTEKLYRKNLKFKKQYFKLIDPGIYYHKSNKDFYYSSIQIESKCFSIYRLIYYVCHNDFDIFDSKVTIDHINVNHLDNRLENLRTATIPEQQRNKLNYKGELIKGFWVLKTGIKKYQGYYRKNGKTITKCFLTEAEARKFHNENKVRF